MQILVIGGSRFVGPALIKLLLDRKDSVIVLNRGTRSIPGTRQLIADRNDADAVETAVASAGTFDAAIDLSCYNASQADIAWRSCATRTKRWIHLSTVAVYADLDCVPDETAPTGSAPVWGEYGVRKSEADDFLLSQTGPPLTILRPPYLYGPGNHIDRETFIWKRALRGRPVLIPGNGEAIVQFLHIEDLASAFVTVLDHVANGSHIYNVAGDEQVSLKDYVQRLAAICGASDTGLPVGATDAGYDARDYFPFGGHPCRLQTSLIKDELHWKPHYTFQEGFAQTYATYDPKTLRECPLNLTVEDKILERLT